MGWYVRLLVVPAGVGSVLVYSGPSPQVGDWVVMGVAAALTLAGGTAPTTVAVGQSVLLVVVERFTEAGAMPVKWVASLAVFEVAVRRWGLPAVVAAGALATAYLAKADFAGDLTPLLFKITVVVGAPLLLGGYQRNLRRMAEQARAAADDAERRRELRADAARLAERTAIARELHDVVAHHLASMALRVGVARHVLPDVEPRVREVLDDVHGNTTTALADLRRFVTTLRDPEGVDHLPVDSTGLPQALRDLADRSRRAGLDVDLALSGDVAALDAVRGLAVLRLVQEGLTNVAKHAGPGSAVAVGVDCADGVATVEIADNGRGHGDGAPGVGLIGLRERVALVGGELTSGPTAHGWRLSAVLPRRSV
ncbi:sensor histidine kinase [Actinosynnema sp. CS-041913]|uniref:sensor histidine kinase n=1 Tax=Actinosynnema sp. CS-041913 TaxID=3239917 RepID=UPI003D944E21